MTNYSRTTLRELKKRYLNILKKCLLANLMMFTFALPSMAEIITDENGNVFISHKGNTEQLLEFSGINLNEDKHTYENIDILLENLITDSIVYFAISRKEDLSIKDIKITLKNIKVSADGFRPAISSTNPYAPTENLTNIKSYTFNADHIEVGPRISGLYTHGTDLIFAEPVILNFNNVKTTARLSGLLEINHSLLTAPSVSMSVNKSDSPYIVGLETAWLGSTWMRGDRHIFKIDDFELNVKNSNSATKISGIYSTPTSSSSEEHVLFNMKTISLKIENTNANDISLIYSTGSKIDGSPNLTLQIDKDSKVANGVYGYQALHSGDRNFGYPVATIGEINMDIAGDIGFLHILDITEAKSISTCDMTVNFLDTTVEEDVVGAYLGENNKSVKTKDFNVNVSGDTVVKGSLQGTNKPTSEILTIGDTTLTVQENSKLTVGSIDKETGEFKGEISAINKISLKENSLLEALINPIQPVVMSIDEETTPINKKLFETNVSMDNNATLRIRNNSNLHTLNSNNGIIDLDQTTSDSTINIQELEGEGTTILTDSTEVAKTTIGNNKSKKLTVAATSKLNDETNNPQQLAEFLSSVVEIEEGEKDLTLAAEEGKIARPMTAELKDGSVKNLQVKSNTVTETVKDVMGLQVLSFRNQINDVQKRMGDLRLDENTKGTWVRTFGGDVKFGDMGLKNKYNTIQAGADFKKGNAYFGIMASLTEGESDMDRGTGEDKTYGMGVYAGYMADNGWYVDATAKQMHLQNKFKARYNTGELSRGSYKTWGTSVSLEAGKRVKLPCGFFVEPQAEVMYGRVQGINYTTSAGVKVEQEAFESLIGRAGLSVGKTFKDKGSVYANVSVLNDFAGKVKTTFSYWNQETKTRDDMGGAWTEFAVGGTYKLNKNTAVYGEFATSKGTDLTNPVQWSLGLRFSF